MPSLLPFTLLILFQSLIKMELWPVCFSVLYYTLPDLEREGDGSIIDNRLAGKKTSFLVF